MTEKEFISELKLHFPTYQEFRDRANKIYKKHFARKDDERFVRKDPAFFTPDDEANFRMMSCYSKQQYESAEGIIDIIEKFLTQNTQ